MINRGLIERVGRVVPPAGPQRSMVPSTFVNLLGNGLFNTASVLYFTLVVHLTAAQVGIGLTIAGLIGLVAGIPAGILADRHGPWTVTVATLAVQALTVSAFLAIHSALLFTLVACADRMAASANNAARGALIARVGGGRPAEFRAKLRTFGNAGIVLGALGSGIAVEIGSRAAYTGLILADAASFIAAALFLLRVPRYPPSPRPASDETRSAFADRPFAAFAALEGAMGLQYQVVSLMLPIWIATRTHAPHWTVAAAFALNSVVCVLLQARIGARVATTQEGGNAFRRAGLVFLASCPLIALSADVPGTLAPVLVMVAMCVHSVGEIWESSASMALGFGLAPDHAQGRYQGSLGLGFDAGQALGPVVLTTVFLGLGQPGWLLLGLCFAGLGALGPTVTRWAERTPPRPFAAVPPPLDTSP
ncbi:MAG TPA: MFS transporter [Actinospica sp.]|nr:MFS transporter [Actinospica sp.]